MGKVDMNFKYQGSKTHDTAEGLRRRQKARQAEIDAKAAAERRQGEAAALEVSKKVRRIAL